MIMILYMGPGGGLDFGNTRNVYKVRMRDILPIMGINVYTIPARQTFGTPIEYETFRCGAGHPQGNNLCQRILPQDLMTLDHVFPRHRLPDVFLMHSNDNTPYISLERDGWHAHREVNDLYLFDSTGRMTLTRVGVSEDGGEIQIPWSNTEGVLRLKAKDCMENDMTNLVGVCQPCNNLLYSMGW